MITLTALEAKRITDQVNSDSGLLEDVMKQILIASKQGKTKLLFGCLREKILPLSKELEDLGYTVIEHFESPENGIREYGINIYWSNPKVKDSGWGGWRGC